MHFPASATAPEIRHIRRKCNFSFGPKRSKLSLMDNNAKSNTDSDSPWGPRVPVTIDSDRGVMVAGQVTRPLEIDGDVSMALSSYLSMIYELRSMVTGVIPLRQEDVLALANAFEMEESQIAEKLARLMHCDDLQTRRFVQMVKKGRVLVPVSMVATGAMLSATLLFVSPNQNTSTNTQTRADTEVVSTEKAPVSVPVSVDIGDAAQVQRANVTDEVDDTSNDASTSEVKSSSGSSVTDPNVGPGEVIIGEGISVSRDE